jgi:hypothetical protein
MTTTQRPTFTQRGGDVAGFFYLLASGGVAPPSLTFDFTTGTLPGAITFTRASIGTYTNNAGTLITASNNVARFNYIAGVANLLIEGSATNLILQSNNFSNAVAWSLVNGCVVTPAQFTSPDGTNNGWSITSGTGNASLYQIITYAVVPYVMSAWVKTITGGTHFEFMVQGTSASSLLATSTLTRFSTTVLVPGDGGTLVRINEVVALRLVSFSSLKPAR